MSNSGQVLTSDEVQALVDAMASGEVDVSPDTAASAAPAVQAYSLVSTDTTSRSQLAAIEMINDRFARQLRGGLLNLLRQARHGQRVPLREGRNRPCNRRRITASDRRLQGGR